MKPLVSIVIPIAPYHADISVYAIDSAQSQTIPAQVITVEDREARGAGFARNRGLEQVTTPFVIFLDADDTIAETFVEKTLRAYEPGHYVYTDWLAGKAIHFTDTPWNWGDGKRDWHPVTALLPTEVLFNLNGFREDVPGGEDAELFFELVYSGVCPIRVPEPLFQYSNLGKRGKAFVGTAAHDDYLQRMETRYGVMGEGCCGGNAGPGQFSPDSEELKPGFVWAQPTWGGNRDQRGSVSGLMYRHVSNNKIIQVDIRDVEHRPDLWRAIVQQTFNTPAKPDLKPFLGKPQPPFPQPPAVAQGVVGIAQSLWPERHIRDENEAHIAIQPAKVNPDVKGVLALAKGIPAEKLLPIEPALSTEEFIADVPSVGGFPVAEPEPLATEEPEQPKPPKDMFKKKPGRPAKK